MKSMVRLRSTPANLLRNFVSQWIKLPDGFHAVLGTLFVMAPISPFFMPVIRRDSGVFLYSGWRMLAGELPYRDLWDHKPPMILYLNEAGLALANGSRWGVWFLESCFLFAAVFIGLKLLRNAFGRSPSLLTTYFWLFGMTGLISGGNYTTEYTLPLQFACYWFYGKTTKHFEAWWRYYLIGVLCGIALLLKQNTIGIGIAIIIHMLMIAISTRQFKQVAIHLLIMGAGGLTVVSAMVLFLLDQKILVPFWDATVSYNVAYLSTNITERVMSIILGLFNLNGLAGLASIGWIIGLLTLLHRLKLPRIPGQNTITLLTIALLDLPIELSLLGVTGNSYRHYYLSLLPTCAVLTGFVFWSLRNQLADANTPAKIKQYLQVAAVSFFLVCATAAAMALITDWNYPTRRSINTDEVLQYIQQNTDEDDYVLMWGAETGFNFASHRRSPSRFSYQYPLYMNGYTDHELVEEFLEDILENKPALIIDTKTSLTPMFKFKVTSPRIEELTAKIKNDYRVADQLGAWTVYEYAGE